MSVHEVFCPPFGAFDSCCRLRGTKNLNSPGTTAICKPICQRGLRPHNDEVDAMQLLTRRLSYLNVHPYYTFVHDMVRGVEELRTPPTAERRLMN